MPKKIIGLTGSLGSGCTRSAKHLQEKGYAYISISEDILKPKAKKCNEPFNTREEKQNFGNYVRRMLREQYKNSLLDIVHKSGDKVVIESFRNPIEIDFLREEFPHFYLIALFAPEELRKQRKKDENHFDKLDERDAGERDKLGQQVRKCVTNADIVIDNSTQWEKISYAKNFFKKFDSYIRLLEKPYRCPTEKEMLMHLAYSVSLRSECIQKQVGAVITDENYRVLSTGYNDVPRGSESCLDLYRECYREIKKRENLLDSINNGLIKFCPHCGVNLQGLEEKDGIICKNCGEDFSKLISPGKELDYCRSLHAEENAILSNPYTADYFYSKNKKMTMFTTTFPCMLCAKKIANAGIGKLIFVEPYPIKESRKILEDNDVEIEVFEGVKSLKFNWIFRKRSRYIKNFAFEERKKLTKIIKGGNYEKVP